jgi:predicted nucleic acid-binding protein
MVNVKTKASGPRVFVVIDAGPMIALAVAGLLPIALSHLGRLMVPEAVVHECISHRTEPGAAAIRDALNDSAIVVIPEAEIVSLDPAYAQGLGGGEQAVLAYVMQNDYIALVDDLRARRTALRLGIKTVRTGAILLALKRAGRITSIRPTLQVWRDHGYFLSNSVIDQLLTIASEH